MRKRYPLRQAGRYKFRVTFQNFQVHQDSLGGSIYSWSDKGSYRVYMHEIKGDETFNDMMIYGRINYIMEMQFIKSLKLVEVDRVVFYNAYGNKLVGDIYKVETYEELGKNTRIYMSILSPDQYIQPPGMYHLEGGAIVDQNSKTDVTVHNPGGTVKPPDHGHPHAIPHVVSSTILTGHENEIKVVFDIDMLPNMQHGHQGISIHEDTKVYTPDHITWDDPKTMIVHVPKDIYKGVTVSWSYDDSVTDADLMSKDNTELINQTYGVTNNSIIPAPTPPHVLDATISNDDKRKIRIKFDKNIKLDPFTVDINTVFEVYKNHDYINKIPLIVGTPGGDILHIEVLHDFNAGDSYEFKYIGNNNILSDPGNMEMIKNVLHQVTNRVTAIALKPAWFEDDFSTDTISQYGFKSCTISYNATKHALVTKGLSTSTPTAWHAMNPLYDLTITYDIELDPTDKNAIGVQLAHLAPDQSSPVFLIGYLANKKTGTFYKAKGSKSDSKKIPVTTFLANNKFKFQAIGNEYIFTLNGTEVYRTKGVNVTDTIPTAYITILCGSYTKKEVFIKNLKVTKP